ncbi:CoA transferase [Bradyrhizobium sp. 159]|uniref:CaiB/BaiF CoA transferase family protein n=1 Tax=Bradyrhizobium sp. 159 TaxID=2782632 RepID=UPI001FF844E4|nr:CoA transferase [Bradyrhizobium sp. 159]MCK1619714.1 CoA transferase [Bradyrhizobium sp. 159]
MIAEQAAGRPKTSKRKDARNLTRRPLHSVRVVDLTHVLAGPICTTILADLGADVVKIERLGQGDISRKVEPCHEGESYYFAALNRNKRSLALDLKCNAGRHILEQLVERADVLVENFRPGALEALGFGYDRLLELNPSLVICSISGFGQTGPLRDYKSFDLVAQAMTGLISLTREGTAPLRIVIGDILAGVYGSVSIASALVGRIGSGRGCVIDLSLFESLLTIFPYFAGRYLADGELPAPTSSGDAMAVPYGIYRAADDDLVIAAYGDHLWQSLCRAIDLAELAADEELNTNAGRLKRREEVESALVERLKTKTVAQWCDVFAAAGIPHAPIVNIGAALDHPHTRSRGMIVEFEHPKCGMVKSVGSAIHINGEPIPGSATPGPILGEHTEQLLTELGYNSAMIVRLRTEGAVG